MRTKLRRNMTTNYAAFLDCNQTNCDGHTASLFPGSKALDETKRLVVANWVEKFQQYRITFTFPVLNHAAETMFLVSGSDKSQILRDVWQTENTVYPAQRVTPDNGVLLWLVDQAADDLA